MTSRGKINNSNIKAKYLVQPISDYMNNPLIEALPPIWSEDDVIDMLRAIISYDPNERFLPPEIRGHCVERLFHCFEPLEKHLDIEQKLSRVIRQGYISRNPLSAEYASKLQENYRIINNGLYEIPTSPEVGTSALGFTIIGFSGVGKTKGIERILSLYPQLIVHTNYKGEELHLNQIPWLKIDCPFDGSLKGLCYSFFAEVDRILGSNHLLRVSRGRPVLDTLVGQMSQIAYLHCLGVLVVDEIQHLSVAKSGGAEKMLNFFVSLINTMKVPVVLIGTAKALSIVQGQFRQARRGTGQGDVIWERLQRDQMWDIFIKSIWKYQWTDEPCQLTEELDNALYEESQGIIDVAVKIYAISQWEIIAAGHGKITPELIRKVCESNLSLIKPMLAAIKSGDIKQLAKYDDIAPLEIEAIRSRYQQQLRSQANSPKESIDAQNKLLFEQVVSRLLNVGIETVKAKESAKMAIEKRDHGQTIEQISSIALNLALSSEEKPTNRTKRPAKGKIGKEQGETRTVAKRAGKSEASILDDLKKKGKIKPPLDKIF